MRYLRCGITVLILASGALGSAAEPPSPVPTGSDVERFVEAFWTENGIARKVPGMMFAYVSVGDPPILGGFGTADIATGTATNPREDVFRIASVSKIFVGLAAAKMIEEGIVDPEQDVNSYLDFPVPSPFGTPITLHALLTHTAGLDDLYFADTSRTEEGQDPLGAHLSRRLPPQVYPIGTTITYSNYGYALAAYVLERASGVDFADYVRDEILLPLGMTRSGYGLTQERTRRLAKGYELSGTGHNEQPYTFTHRYPSTTFMTTAGDMAVLISALLAGDCDEGELCVWGEQAKRLIFEQQETMSARLPGRTYGFAEWVRHRSRGIWHDGATAGFAADLMLIPEEGVGFFIADNLQSSGLSSRLKLALLDEFFLKEETPPPSERFEEANVSDYAGAYARVRRNHSTVEKIRLLQAGPVEFRPGASGDLVVFDTWRLMPIGEDLFQRTSGDGRYVVFGRDEAGQVVRAYMDWGGMPATLQRLSFWDTPKVFYAAASVALTLLTIVSVYWLIRRRKNPRACSRGFSLSLLGLTILSWVFIVGVTLYLMNVSVLAFRFGEATGLKALLVMPLMALCLLGYVLFQAARNAIAGEAGILGNLMNLAACSSAILLYGLLHNWNMIGLRL